MGVGRVRPRVAQYAGDENIATMLITWELGGGLGHLLRIKPIVDRLMARRHRVVLALRDLRAAESFFPGVPYLQAPRAVEEPEKAVREPSTFADILFNCGWRDPGELAGLTTAWRTLDRLVRPDVVVMDYSPTALLAWQGRRAKRMLLSTGFNCPPDVSPLPGFHKPGEDYAEQLYQRECRVLDNANQCLQAQGLQPLPRVGAVFHSAEENILATFRELDCYAERRGAEYWGIWFGNYGAAPTWPSGTGPKIFAYIKPFPAYCELLSLIRRSEVRALVYLSGVTQEFARRHEAGNLRIAPRPLDIRSVAQQCDFAVLNGGRGATAAMLLAGKPILQIPIFVEQMIVGQNVAGLGAGEVAQMDAPAQISEAFGRLLTCDRYACAAQQFARRYADFDPSAQVDRVVRRVEQLSRQPAAAS